MPQTGELFRDLTIEWYNCCCCYCLVTKSCPTWWPHELQHTRSSPSPRVYSCPLSCWWHPTISSSVTSFSCPQFFPASESFPISRPFASGGQSTGASVSASVFPMNRQGWFPLGLTGLISLLSKGFSRVFSSNIIRKHQFSALSLLYAPTHTSIHDYWKNHSFKIFVSKMMSLLSKNMLSRFVIAFLPRSKCLLVSRLQSASAVILEPKMTKSVIVSTFPPSICHEEMGPNAMILVFWCWNF